MHAVPVKEGDVLAERYRVERVLAAGGMGVVVAARHIGLGQRVAVKFLLSNLPATEEAAMRFDREARAAALLRSEHTARVIDIGKLASGAPYMVMEFLEGRDLATVLEKDGPLPVETAVGYVLQACEGLAEAHAAKIVHRDLKPSNLFCTMRPDGSPLIKILDFGISKVADADTAAVVTSTAAVLGSPMYMSPEQMESSKSVDARADVWSLGVLLHQLLTGTTPFVEETLPGLLLAIATKEPKRLREKAPHAPAELEDVILRCLRKAPKDRYQNVAELAVALLPFAPDSKENVERTKRLSGSLPPQPSPDASGAVQVATDAQTSTDPFARTKTALAGSTGNLRVPRRTNWAFLAVAAIAVSGVATSIALWKSGPTPAAPSSMAPVLESHPTAIVSTLSTAAPDHPAHVGEPTASIATASQPPPALLKPATATTTHRTAPSASAPALGAASVAPSTVPSSLTGFSLDRK